MGADLSCLEYLQVQTLVTLSARPPGFCSSLQQGCRLASSFSHPSDLTQTRVSRFWVHSRFCHFGVHQSHVCATSCRRCKEWFGSQLLTTIPRSRYSSNSTPSGFRRLCQNMGWDWAAYCRTRCKIVHWVLVLHLYNVTGGDGNKGVGGLGWMIYLYAIRRWIMLGSNIARKFLNSALKKSLSN